MELPFIRIGTSLFERFSLGALPLIGPGINLSLYKDLTKTCPSHSSANKEKELSLAGLQARNQVLIAQRFLKFKNHLLSLARHLLGLIVHTNHTIRAVKLATSASFSSNRLCSCASSSSIVLLAGGGRNSFDVEAASAAATITDTFLGRNSSDTLLEDRSGVI